MERKITNDVVTEIGLTQRNKILTLEGDVAAYDLRGMKKEFPNITTLKIKNGVTAIRILNRTFPNIRKVISESPLFETKETMLIRTSKLKSEKEILLNAFFETSTRLKSRDSCTCKQALEEDSGFTAAGEPLQVYPREADCQSFRHGLVHGFA